MKKGLSSVVIVLISVIFSGTGCSVKEDRSVCPCRLMVDFRGVDYDMPDGLCLDVMSSDGFLFHDEVDVESLPGGIYQTDVPKKMFTVCVYDGDDGFWDQGRLSIPDGMQCPPYYASYMEVNASGESAACSPVMYKCFCNATVRFKTDGDGLPFSVRVVGNVAGYDMHGAPEEGRFSYSSAIGPDGEVQVRLPRQTDGSLRLEIVEDGIVIREFALGEFIIECGYDWMSPGLKDVEVLIDYSKSDVTFIVEGWEHEFTFDITI